MARRSLLLAVTIFLAGPPLTPAVAQTTGEAQLQVQMRTQMDTLRANGAAAVSEAASPQIERQQHTITAADLMSVVMPGVSTTASQRAYLRFSNGDATTQTATVQLRDPATGEGLFTWTSPPLAAGGTLEMAVSDIIAQGTPIHNLRLPAQVTAEVTGGFIGHVQHLMLDTTTGALSNLSTCGMVFMADALSLPYVSGPGRVDVYGQLRITNATTDAASVKLTFKDNKGQTSVWTSPSIPHFATLTRGIIDIMGLASPPFDPTAKSLSVVSDPAPMGVTLSYQEGLASSAVMGDFSAACMLTSAVMDMGDGHDGHGTTGTGAGATPAPTPAPAPAPTPDPMPMPMMCDMNMWNMDMNMMCAMSVQSGPKPTAQPSRTPN